MVAFGKLSCEAHGGEEERWVPQWPAVLWLTEGCSRAAVDLGKSFRCSLFIRHCRHAWILLGHAAELGLVALVAVTWLSRGASPALRGWGNR